jgi:hypothetical protein
LTAIVEVDVAVVVEPILDLDPWTRGFRSIPPDGCMHPDQGATSTMASMFSAPARSRVRIKVIVDDKVNPVPSDLGLMATNPCDAV